MVLGVRGLLKIVMIGAIKLAARLPDKQAIDTSHLLALSINLEFFSTTLEAAPDISWSS